MLARRFGLGIVLWIACACACEKQTLLPESPRTVSRSDVVDAAGPAATDGERPSTAALPEAPRRVADDPRRRATVEVLPGDLVSGAVGAPVTVVGLLRLSPGSASPGLHALVRLALRADAEGLLVVFRPRLAALDATDLRLARLFHALPDDAARRRWLGELLGASADPWRSAERLAAPGVSPVERGDGAEVDGRLLATLREQLRLGVDGADVVFVNGQRLDPAPGEGDLLFATRREAQRLQKAERARAEDPGSAPPAMGQAEEIGPRSLPVPAADRAPGRLDVVAFVDFRDPHSRRLARHLDELLKTSPQAVHVRLRLAAFPLERHAGAAEAAAMARCALEHAEAPRVLAAFFGDPYDRPDVRPEGLCDALHLSTPACDAVRACATLPATAEAVLAERAAARRAGVQGPPALFIEGRRVAPRGRAFSRAFLEEVLLSYYLKSWTLPPDGRLAAVPWPGTSQAPDRRSP